MIKIKNINTGEIKKVFQSEATDAGQVRNNEGKKFGQRFINAWAGILTETTDENGQQVFNLSDEWEIVKKGKRTPKPKPATHTEPQPTTAADTTTATEIEPAASEPVQVQVEPTVEPTTEGASTSPSASDTNNDNERVLIEALRNLRGGAIDEARVRAIVAEEMKNVKPTAHEVTIVTTDNGTHEVQGATCAQFNALCMTIKKGTPLYLYGEAGTGKSHTCKQIAEALGLAYYPMQQLLYAHEVVGYATADGSLVETPFYKAFTQGGLVDLEEFDSSSPEAALVINGAIANGRCNFPVVGVKEAHPDFRVVATGNTKMTGADMEYTGRSVMDASTKNRFYFSEVGYDARIEDALTGGDLTISEFCRDLRRAKNEAGITLCVSYRSIKMLADVDMQQAWGDTELMRGSIFKELEADEIRILHERLSDKSNRWAKAMEQLF